MKLIILRHRMTNKYIIYLIINIIMNLNDNTKNVQRRE